MTHEQLSILKADMAADPVFGPMPQTPDNAIAIAAAYNQPATPDFWVWRTSLAEKDIYEDTSHAGSTWNWATYKSQTVQDRDSWARMFGPGMVNPALKQTRDGWAAIFGGQGASLAQVNFLLALSQVKAQRGEKLFATGVGTTADTAVRTLEGNVQATDVEQAWALP